MTNNSKQMFDTYVKYFPSINKLLKLDRGGKVKVIDQKTNSTEIYQSWDELNNVYKQVPGFKEEVKEEVRFKFWTFGHPTKYNELKQLMEAKYFELVGRKINLDSLDFKKSNWVYFMSPTGDFCQTSNEIVLSLLKDSTEWEQLTLPIKQFTKQDIAVMIGMSVDQFEIV